MCESRNCVCYWDRMQDMHRVYETDEHACVMKLFPMCHMPSRPDAQDFNRFHVRFYFPRNMLVDSNKKADRVVIMTNGLDEMFDYDLYNEIGAGLASRGIVSILLPLPDHLNRHTRYRILMDPTYEQLVERPSQILMRDPMKLHSRYLQFAREIDELIRHLRGHCDHGACSFYRSLFRSDARISLLGYSLGAAAMLSHFLDQEAKLSACVLLCGAVDLAAVVPHGMFDGDVWRGFVKKLKQDYKKKHQGAPPAGYFEQIFLGEYVDDVPDLLKEHGKRILFMYGGRDQMVAYESLQRISPDRWGLSMMVFPGINHFLRVDEEWKKWLEVVVSMISSFEANALRRTITKKAIRDKHEAEPREAGHDDMVRGQLLGWKGELLVDSLKKRRLLEDSIRDCDFDKLMIGQRLYKHRFIGEADLTRAIEIQDAQPEGQKMRLGEILSDLMQVVRKQHVEAMLRGPTQGAINA